MFMVAGLRGVLLVISTSFIHIQPLSLMTPFFFFFFPFPTFSGVLVCIHLVHPPSQPASQSVSFPPRPRSNYMLQLLVSLCSLSPIAVTTTTMISSFFLIFSPFSYPGLNSFCVIRSSFFLQTFYNSSVHGFTLSCTSAHRLSSLSIIW